MKTPEPGFDLEPAHRWFAIEWNNASWTALESSEPAEDALHWAHGSLAHWRHVGNQVNCIRALCVVANAESRFGSAASANRFAELGIRLANELGDAVDGLEDWDHAFLADAAMRATKATLLEEQQRNTPDPDRLAQLQVQAERTTASAKELGDAIADENDRQFFFAWFAKP